MFFLKFILFSLLAKINIVPGLWWHKIKRLEKLSEVERPIF
jgi:hypothetical protein